MRKKHSQQPYNKFSLILAIWVAIEEYFSFNADTYPKITFTWTNNCLQIEPQI